MSMRMAMALGSMLALGVPASARAGPFGPGEELSYSIVYLSMTAGTTLVQVGARMPLEGRSVWPLMVVGETQSLFRLFPIKDKYVSWWDPKAHRTVGSDFFADENHKRKRTRIRLDHDKGNARLWMDEPNQPRREEQLEFRPGSHDVCAAIFALREHPIELGESLELPVFTGKNGFVMKATVESKERIQVPAGEFQAKKLAIHVEFQGNFASKRDLAVWLSDDERQVPLRFDAELMLGTVSAVLTGYKKGLPSLAVDEAN